MKISDNTRDILKNFSTINSGIVVKEGNTFRTISAMKNIMAKATVSESFSDFAIYDLSEFLGATSLFDSAEYNFGDSSVVVSDANSSMVYFYAAENTVISPQKDINFPEPEITFTLTQQVRDAVEKASAVLGVSDMILESDGTVVRVSVRDKKNATSNVFSRIIADGDGTKYKMNFKIENLKLLNGDYDVFVSSKNISQFKHKNLDLEYFIALEPDSKYNA
jgi:hypothetical protein